MIKVNLIHQIFPQDSVKSFQLKGFNMLQRYLILAALILVFGKARSQLMIPDSFQIKYIQQNVDHFSFANNRTFQQKYLINDQFWSSENHGPIFFVPGKETPIDEYSFDVRIWMLWANNSFLFNMLSFEGFPFPYRPLLLNWQKILEHFWWQVSTATMESLCHLAMNPWVLTHRKMDTWHHPNHWPTKQGW